MLLLGNKKRVKVFTQTRFDHTPWGTDTKSIFSALTTKLRPRDVETVGFEPTTSRSQVEVTLRYTTNVFDSIGLGNKRGRDLVSISKK